MMSAMDEPPRIFLGGAGYCERAACKELPRNERPISTYRLSTGGIYQICEHCSHRERVA